MSIALVILGAVLATVLLNHWRSSSRRRKYPKDYGYRVCTAFGPELGLARIERLRKHIPWLAEAELQAWLPEFEQVDKLLGELATQGGPKKLGRASVESSIRARFPFLQHEGLRQAVFLVGYGAHHDGHDR
jgi:hypothetical protein